ILHVIGKAAHAHAPTRPARRHVCRESPRGFGTELVVAQDAVTEGGMIELEAELFGSWFTKATPQRDPRAPYFGKLVRGRQARRSHDAVAIVKLCASSGHQRPARCQ